MQRILSVLIISLVVALDGCSSEKEDHKKYIKQVELLKMKITSSSADSEKVINSYSRLWLKAIEDGIRMEEYAKYYEKEGDIDTIKSSREEIQSLIKELASPPDEYQSIHDELFTLYKNYESYVDLAIQPSGNLNNYNNNAQSLAAEILSGIRAVNGKMAE